MSGADIADLIVGIAVVVLAVSRQLMARRFNDNYPLAATGEVRTGY